MHDHLLRNAEQTDEVKKIKSGKPNSADKAVPVGQGRQ